MTRVRTDPATAILIGGLALAVGWPTFSGGGFSASSQTAFIMLTTIVLLLAVWTVPADVAALGRRLVCGVFAALTAIGLLSLLWTHVTDSLTLRTALIPFAYGEVAIVAGIVTRRSGPVPIMVGIGMTAVVEAALGLSATALHRLPDAERLVLVWRPGGTFEYQPALALLEAGALGIFWQGARARHAPIRVAAGIGAGLAGGVLGIADDRLGAGLAITVVIALAFGEWRTARRFPAAVSVAVCTGAGAFVAYLRLDHAVLPQTPAPGSAALVLLAVSIATVAVVVDGIGRLVIGDRGRRRSIVAASVSGLIAVIVWRVVAANRGRGVSHYRSAGFFHGRIQEWHAALLTWGEHPLLGGGSGSYAALSSVHQQIAISLYPHQLVLETGAELGIAGALVAIALFVTVATLVVRGVRRTPRAWALAPLAVGFLVSNLLDWTWHIAAVGALWALAVGAILALDGARPTASTQRSTASAT